MEQRRFLKRLQRDISGTEGVIRARIMQEDAVVSGDRQYNGIRGLLTLCNKHAVLCAVP